MKLTFDAFNAPDMTADDAADAVELIARQIREGHASGDAHGRGRWSVEDLAEDAPARAVLFLIEVPIWATAYVMAEDEAAAMRIAKTLAGSEITLAQADCEITDCAFVSAEMPALSLSPVATVGDGRDVAFEQGGRADDGWAGDQGDQGGPRFQVVNGMGGDGDEFAILDTGGEGELRDDRFDTEAEAQAEADRLNGE